MAGTSPSYQASSAGFRGRGKLAPVGPALCSHLGFARRMTGLLPKADERDSHFGRLFAG